jgi:hypothetical protein
MEFTSVCKFLEIEDVIIMCCCIQTNAFGIFVCEN